MPSLVMTGFRRRSANSSNPFCDSHISIIRKPLSVGWETCWYIPGSGRASTPISARIARNSLCVKPVTFMVITTTFIIFSPRRVIQKSLLLTALAAAIHSVSGIHQEEVEFCVGKTSRSYAHHCEFHNSAALYFDAFVRVISHLLCSDFDYDLYK